MDMENKSGTVTIPDIIEPEMAELLKEFLEKIKNKSAHDMMSVLAEFNSRLPKDKTFTHEQKSTIIEEALKNMPDEEKNRYKTFFKMMNLV